MDTSDTSIPKTKKNIFHEIATAKTHPPNGKEDDYDYTPAIDSIKTNALSDLPNITNASSIHHLPNIIVFTALNSELARSILLIAVALLEHNAKHPGVISTIIKRNHTCKLFYNAFKDILNGIDEDVFSCIFFAFILYFSSDNTFSFYEFGMMLPGIEINSFHEILIKFVKEMSLHVLTEISETFKLVKTPASEATASTQTKASAEAVKTTRINNKARQRRPHTSLTRTRRPAGGGRTFRKLIRKISKNKSKGKLIAKSRTRTKRYNQTGGNHSFELLIDFFTLIFEKVLPSTEIRVNKLSVTLVLLILFYSVFSLCNNYNHLIGYKITDATRENDISTALDVIDNKHTKAVVDSLETINDALLNYLKMTVTVGVGDIVAQLFGFGNDNYKEQIHTAIQDFMGTEHWRTALNKLGDASKSITYVGGAYFANTPRVKTSETDGVFNRLSNQLADATLSVEDYVYNLIHFPEISREAFIAIQRRIRRLTERFIEDFSRFVETSTFAQVTHTKRHINGIRFAFILITFCSGWLFFLFKKTREIRKKLKDKDKSNSAPLPSSGDSSHDNPNSRKRATSQPPPSDSNKNKRHHHFHTIKN